MAQRLAQIEGERAELIKTLKLAAAEQPIAIEGGGVGWQKTEKQEPTASAAFQMFAEWRAKDGEIDGFLTALKPGMTSLQSIAKTLHKDQAERDRCLAEWTKTKPGREFGAYKKD